MPDASVYETFYQETLACLFVAVRIFTSKTEARLLKLKR
jgi:hypothetical protein